MIYSVKAPDGSILDIKGPEGASQEQVMQAAHGLWQQHQQRVSAQTQADRQQYDPTSGMSGMDKFLSGAGKSVSDIGLGIRQLTGFADQKEVDERKALDRPLMDTGAGVLGDVAGNVAMALIPGLGAAGAGKALAIPGMQTAGRLMLASPATVGGALTQGGMGAAQGLLQPVATGESRTFNTGVGGVGGAAVPVAGMALKGTSAAIEPMYSSGRDSIIGRTLRRVAGSEADANAAQQALANARELVPGSMPTAGMTANNAGIAALERSASAVEPTVTVPMADRLKGRNQALVDALRGVAPGTKDALESARDAAASPLYKQAREQGVDQAMADALKPQINSLMERMPSGVMEKAKELARLSGESLEKGGSVTGLHWMKVAVDDMLSAGKQTGIGKETTRALTTFKNDLVSVMDDLSPAYGKARETYAQLSRPVNQADVVGEIAKRSVRPLDDTLTPAAYARALSDDTARSATGFNKATLSNTMEPSQLSTLNAIKDELVRGEYAKTAGRGVGSDTVQKMAYHNLMEQSGLSGLPNLLSRPVQMAEYLSRAAYGSADRQMTERLAHALLDPKETAMLMGKGVPNAKVQKLIDAMRTTVTPAAVGSGPALLDARQ
jgi:hypothetical protein